MLRFETLRDHVQLGLSLLDCYAVFEPTNRPEVAGRALRLR